ncbi:ATP-binding cassette domain-containing protein [Modestobacter sp. I12A-02628]|uniref:ABC-F family ATP-binding cassette domain-containing protein n=1 Tax=Goekera deserti TaxID=2497753 RepID=A0A7K3WIK9_9ACTN|nr:ABC-F family ATP-binding cassette domain-containing protein [Goekera deserti]MPQ97107.1 ATP-binding cassette domain-containing protein [Goekera deserti]NDI46575.1 ATP-binding cassette domain-containing protein [Goekera deserti]NEL56331.1 ABC-F family ATP-binding cassette domain-containing protein [Goekera deserti]
MSVTCSDLSFSWPDGTPVLDHLSLTLPPGRSGLVAPNGAGKTTLLRLIAGELRPGGGSVTVDGTVGHLRQTLPLTGDRTVADVLGVAPVLAALAAVESGDADEEHLATIGTDWDAEERTGAQLDRLGLGHVPLDRRLDGLSGGQVVSLGLAAQLLRRPDVLLLDEPTNNLDGDARRALVTALETFPGCLVVVSHDRALLDRMERIVELDRGAARTYSGDFTAYEATVAAEQEAAERDVRGAGQDLRRERRDRQLARERAARRQGTAARNAPDSGLPKILLGARKRRAQESAGRADGTHAARVDDARARLDAATRALREESRLALDLPGTVVPAGRTVFRGAGLQTRFGADDVFAPGGVDLEVRGPERIGLTGPNGAGKSTLLRLVSGELPATGGVASRATGRTAYLSQRLDTLDPDDTVAGALARAAPATPEAQRRTLLARFLFRGQRAHLPVGALSGGERLRATLACVLFAEPAPQLLLLDEPTNNLDLVGVAQLESALDAYRGALVVVSHDERFLAALRVDRWLRLAEGRLTPTGAPREPR